MPERIVCDLTQAALAGEEYRATCPRCKLPSGWYAGQCVPVRPCDPERAAKILEFLSNPPEEATGRPRRNPAKPPVKISEEEQSEAMTILGYTPRQIKRWASEVKAWLLAGRPKRTDEEVAAILEICRSNRCGLYQPSGHCGGCGCNVNDSQYAIFNAARMGTKKCPKGFW